MYLTNIVGLVKLVHNVIK